MRLIALLTLPLALAACVPAEPDSPQAPDTCPAASFQGLVGQPRAVLGQMLFPAGTRIIGAHDPVTADFNPARLNVEIGHNDRIAKVACY